MRASDIPDDFPERARLYPDADEWLNPGDSVIVAPGGEVVAGPLHQDHGQLVADIEPARVGAEHRTLDVAGHYGRTEVFNLIVNRKASDPISYDSG
jgi:nitrilase